MTGCVICEPDKERIVARAENIHALFFVCIFRSESITIAHMLTALSRLSIDLPS
jgi:hypothetical protein